MKIEITYTNGRSTMSTMPKDNYESLKAWWLDPKARKTYHIDGEGELLIHKDQIAYLLAKKE